MARGEKRHVGSDIDDHLAAGTGRGHVQLRGARAAGHGGIHVEGAAQDGEITEDALRAVDVKGALIDVGRAQRLDLSGQIERTGARLGEDAVADAIGDIRGQGEHARPVDMHDQVGIRRRITLDTAARDREVIAALEDKTSGCQPKGVAGADSQPLIGAAWLQLDLIDRPGSRQAEVPVDSRGDSADDVKRPAGARRIIRIIIESDGRRTSAGIPDEIDSSVTRREHDLTHRGAIRNIRVSGAQLQHGARRRRYKEAHARCGCRNATQCHGG